MACKHKQRKVVESHWYSVAFCFIFLLFYVTFIVVVGSHEIAIYVKWLLMSMYCHWTTVNCNSIWSFGLMYGEILLIDSCFYEHMDVECLNTYIHSFLILCDVHTNLVHVYGVSNGNREFVSISEKQKKGISEKKRRRNDEIYMIEIWEPGREPTSNHQLKLYIVFIREYLRQHHECLETNGIQSRREEGRGLWSQREGAITI